MNIQGILIINTYNRPEYLTKCLASIQECAAELQAQRFAVIISDDASTNTRTLELIKTFALENVFVAKRSTGKNKGIAEALLSTLEFVRGHYNPEYYITLDGDAIVASGFVERALDLMNRTQLSVVSLFNCEMIDKRGDLRHPQLFRGEDFIIKRKIGGVNMAFNRRTLNEIVYHGIKRGIDEADNFDHAICDVAHENGVRVVVSKPSYVQHIGERSSMNHNHMAADRAVDFIGKEIQHQEQKPGVYGRRLAPKR
jgi:glycosyltransferase involved in cell wall biosynthesis